MSVLPIGLSNVSSLMQANLVSQNINSEQASF